MTEAKKGRKKKKIGRPYALSFSEHIELQKRKAAGEKALDLAVLYSVRLLTVYAYLKLDPFSRSDAPRRAKK